MTIPTLPGGKTYALGAALAVYIIISMFEGSPEMNQEIVFLMLAGMGITNRAAISKARKK